MVVAGSFFRIGVDMMGSEGKAVLLERRTPLLGGGESVSAMFWRLEGRLMMGPCVVATEGGLVPPEKGGVEKPFV